MTHICRLCLFQIPTQIFANYEDELQNKTRIKFVLREIDLDMTTTFTLCNLCSPLLSAAYQFQHKCLVTERNLKQYISERGLRMPIDLNAYRDFIEQDLADIKNEITEEIEENTELVVETQGIVCDKCNNIFNDDESFEAHKEECVLYKSNEDEEEFMTKKEEEKHVAEHPHKCQHCNEYFTTESDLSVHILNHHSPNKNHNKLIFDDNESFDACKDELVLYKSNEDEEEEKHFAKHHHKCQHCNEYFTAEVDLSDHILNHHSSLTLAKKNHTKLGSNKISKEKIKLPPLSRKIHTCSVCQAVFRGKPQLSLHMERHNKVNLNCKICGKIFPGRLTLKKHISSKHKNSITCDTCGKSCCSKSIFLEHMRTHTGERPFRCELCGMAFAQQGTLTSHKRSKHDPSTPFVCDLCGKAFRLKGSLTKHIPTHHYEGTERTFSCEYENCEKKFYCKRQCTVHMKRHGERKILCNLCGMAFFDKNGLGRHMMTHTGERPHECDTCHKTFSSRSNLRVHLKSHRPKIGKVKKSLKKNVDNTT